MLAWALLPREGSAQLVHGRVLEDSTGRTIAGATIQLLRRDSSIAASATSGSFGEFRIRLLEPGALVVRLSHPSYRAPGTDTLTVAAGESVALELHMSPSAISLAPVAVTARVQDSFGGFYRRAREGGFGTYLTREQIEHRAGARVTELLRGVPGIYVESVRRGLGGAAANLLAMRGTAAPRCLPAIFIDGMPIRDQADGIDQMLVPELLEGVEIYTSVASIPPPFYTLDGCGVVAFWTRLDARRPFSWKRVGIAVGIAAAVVLLLR